jgi:hypothetical protein
MRYSSAGLLAAGLALLACGGEGTPFSPTVETVAGSYQATTLTATQGSTTVNLLQGGGSLTLNLLEDGTTTGRLFVPGAGETGGDLDVDLIGTWTLTGSTVTFDQPNSDTFVRDMSFTAERNRIRGEETFTSTGGDFTISVVLTK